jgi:hypothetical protein
MMTAVPRAAANAGATELGTHPGFAKSGMAALAAGILATGPAAAQDWDLSFAPYLWATGIDGDATIGNTTAPLEVNFSDILHVLDGALLGHVEARKGDSGLFGDFIYLATDPEDNVEIDTLILEAGYLHGRDSGGGLTGWEVGVRYWDFETTIVPALVSPLNRSDSWSDFFIGYRRERPMGENWRSVVRGNIGAGGSDLTWGLDLTYLYDYDNGNSFAVGIKVLDVDYEKENNFGIDAHFLGATIGYNFD